MSTSVLRLDHPVRCEIVTPGRAAGARDDRWNSARAMSSSTEPVPDQMAVCRACATRFGVTDQAGGEQTLPVGYRRPAVRDRRSLCKASARQPVRAPEADASLHLGAWPRVRLVRASSASSPHHAGAGACANPRLSACNPPGAAPRRGRRRARRRAGTRRDDAGRASRSRAACRRRRRPRCRASTSSRSDSCGRRRGRGSPRSVALLSSGMRASSTKRVSRSQFAMTYAAALPIESVFSVAWLQSHVFIVASTSALSVRRSSAFFARSPSARSSIS